MLVKSKATPQSHYGLQPSLWKPVNFKLNPFAPEPPVTARADPGPFYPL